MTELFDRLKEESEIIAAWLETHTNHERFEEGFQKLREIYRKMSLEYIKVEYKQEVMF